MTYCHECGSEVAENDAFCPICGITLLPVVVENDEDDALSSTIVISQPEMEIQDNNDTTDGEPADISVSSPENAVPDILSQTKTEDYSRGITEENFEVKTGSVEIPANELVDENDFAKSKSISQDISQPKSIESKEEDALAEISKSAEIKASEKIFENNEFGEVRPVPVSQTESELMSYDETEIKEIPSAVEPATAVEDNDSGGEKIDFDATLPYTAFNAVKQNFDESKTPLSISPNSVLQAPEQAGEILPAAERPLAKPAVELPEAECPPPRFDSVRIMESEDRKKSSQQTDAEKFQTESPIKSSVSISEKSEKNRSHTTPNIGFGDTDGRKRAKLKPLDEGTVLNDRYEIVRKIGGGGMGAVYLASDKNLGGVLRAVKEMVQSYIEEEQQEKAVSDFKRESLLLSTLDHPGIPTIYDYFFDEQEARFYLVMKYISGGDLSARIRSAPEGRIDEKSVTDWGMQVADVLDYLHNREMPIVYRDLKPANIMIDGNTGRVMLIDFGIARFINKEEKGVTAVGTMGYAPPELFSGNVEPRSDIYSLGSTMFHLLTGADPQSNPLLIFDFQKHPRPRQINPQLSDQIEKILMRSVEYSATQRFSSAAELRDFLEKHLKNLNENKLTFGIRENNPVVGLSDQPVFCGFCGQKIVATDMFCAFCGAKQPLAQQGIHSEIYAPQPLTAKIMIIGTNELETPAYRIEKDENLLGRRDPMSNIFPEVDLSKFDPQTKISRRHARIWRDGTQFMVEDLGSSNGTVVLPVVKDTVRLMPHQPYPLANGDKLRLGDTTLHFIIG